ncbi:MAG: protein-disulfide reductase DsbD domain-containing protein [Ferruginibacter sp.]
MKKIFFLAVVLCTSFSLFAQLQNPVHWSFTSKKLNIGTYEIHLTATLDKGWHTYSQTTPDGGPLPTTVTFAKNPLVKMDGTTKEIGKLEEYHEPLFGVDVKQFSDKVDFVQIVKVKGNIKTVVAGNIDFLVCNKQCLPPATKSFSISLK